MKKTRRRALYVFAALLAVVFVLACMAGFAACGGGSEDACADGHTVTDWTTTKEATCTEAGSKTGVCDVCGETVTDTIAALGHTLVKTDAVPATCTTGGNNAYWTCSVCKKVFSDESGTTETTVAGQTTEALGHAVVGTYDSTTQQWTYACSVCKETIDLTTDADAIASVTLQATDEASLAAALTLGGEIVLTADITAAASASTGTTAAFTISKDTEIDLAGSTLSTAESLSSTLNTIIEVSSGVTLTIIDSTGSGTIANTYAGANGNTSVDNAAAIHVAEGGTLVLESGTISSTSVGVRAEGVDSSATGRATVTIDGGEISSTYFSVFASGDADVTINGGTISGTDKGICIGGDSNYGYDAYQTGTKTTLTVTGGEVSCTNDSAICTLGVGSNASAEITISGGTITSSATPVIDQETQEVTTSCPAIYLPTGTLTITGGTISGTTAVEVRGGKVNISGGTLACLYYDEDTGEIVGQGDNASQNKSGAKTYGYALSVYPYGKVSRANYQESDNAVDVTVTGGTFEGDIYVAAQSQNAGSDGSTKWTVDISGSAQTEAPYVVTMTGIELVGYTSEGNEASTGDTVAYYLWTYTAASV